MWGDSNNEHKPAFCLHYAVKTGRGSYELVESRVVVGEWSGGMGGGGGRG